MVSLNDDPWIAQNSKIAPEKLHALGVVNFRWQGAEIGLRSLVVLLTRTSPRITWAIIHDMGDIALSNSIRQISETADLPDNVKEGILFGLKLYDENRLNRNQLTHFLPGAFKGADLSRMKGPEFAPQPIADSLEDIRRVAEEIAALMAYLTGLLNALLQVAYLHNVPPAKQRPPLPEKPPPPKRLWTPPPPNQPKPPRQP